MFHIVFSCEYVYQTGTSEEISVQAGIMAVDECLGGWYQGKLVAKSDIFIPRML